MNNEVVKKKGGYLLLTGLMISSTLAYSQNASPNIIVILADDLGWSSLSTVMDRNVSDSKSDFHQTPNIDRLASQSLRFTNGYAAAPVCSPTRHSIQTGQSPARINHVKVGQPTTHINYETIYSLPRMIKAANPSYATAHFGKWHLGCDPSVMGYDFSDGQTSNKQGGWSKKASWLEVIRQDDPKLVFSLTERSIKFIEEQKSKSKPFFLQLSHYATHEKTICTPGSYDKFEALPKGKKHNLSTFAAMLFDLDKSIGTLLDKVEELGLSDNTYIFFLTDNGGVPFFPPNSPEKQLKKGMGYNVPLQRGKWDLFEGGVRVPFMVKGPGIKPNTFCDVPVITYDLLPTIADIINFKGKLPANLDGQSIKPLMDGKTSIKERALYFHYPIFGGAGIGRPTSAIRDGDFKLIKYWDDGQVLLFNLKNDISEQKDLSNLDVKKAKSLESKLDGYLKSVHAISAAEMRKIVENAKSAKNTDTE